MTHYKKLIRRMTLTAALLLASLVEALRRTLMASLILLWSSFSDPLVLLRRFVAFLSSYLPRIFLVSSSYLPPIFLVPSAYLRRSVGVPSAKRLLRVAVVAGMMILGGGVAWGQTDYSGIYYIQNLAKNSYYMYPVSSDNNSLVKTAENRDTNAIWQIIKSGDYYYIKHYKDGRYLVAADATVETNTVSLVETDSPDETALFKITCKKDCSNDKYGQVILFRPKAAANGNGHIYLNTSGGNNGTNTIGLYDNTGSSEWKLQAFPAAPTFSVSDIKVTMSTPLGTIHYTIDGTTPTSASASGTSVTLEYGPEYYVKALTVYNPPSGDDLESAVKVSSKVQVAVAIPVFTLANNKVTISSSQKNGVTYRYTVSTDGSEPVDPVAPSGAGTNYTTSLSLTANARNSFKAIAHNTVNGTTYSSAVVSFVVDTRTPTEISSLSTIAADLSGSYKLTADIDASSLAASLGNFSGTLDGNNHTISNLSVPLFSSTTNATIRNLNIEQCTISVASGNAGAITQAAQGATRIYNVGVLGGTVSGSAYTGGLVGLLNGTSRVINCYSYANINGGTVKGGIVGYNNYASKSGDIRTMVMNCMFYGDIDYSSGSVYPIYGGKEISNEDNYKLNNYNYFLYEAPFSYNKHITAYNRALAAERRYLNRFEFYRYLVNSTRELAAWYATGSTANAHTVMLKWVLDRSIAPYPILKEQDSYTPGAYTTGRGLYPSVVNYDPDYTLNPSTGAKVARSNVTTRNQGGKLTSMGTNGMLAVTISESNTTAGGQTKPTGAAVSITSRSLPIIDKDTTLFNYNYGKVQLPYYNEVGSGNYTKDRVVTGWKITAITAVAGDPYTSANYTGDNYDSPNYNFADRKSSNKDLYTVSGRVFSQGAYFDVPDGVTSITIEPYWACAAYVSDQYYDCYGKDQYSMGYGVTDFGIRYNNNTKYSINGDNQYVYNSLAKGYGRLETLGMTTSTSIYDYAIVLVGNNHQKGSPKNETKHFTIMSADLDFDNEPDYSLIITTGKQEKISPIRFDFINVPNVAMAHKKTGNTYMGIFGNIKPKGWFETTNTAVLRFSQYEYDSENKSLNEPLILLGGIIDMITSTNGTEKLNTNTRYIHLGSNVCFPINFNNGCHMDKTSTATPHRPISVTGGDYNAFYLSGYLQPAAPACTTANGNQNAECYISGGRFGEVAGAGYEQIAGSVTWQIYNADIENFYGGGINENKPVTGAIATTIRDSYVGIFCGGPKFSNTAVNVSTTATNCTFGTYYGAGYGGTALTRVNSYNKYGTLTYNWNGTSESVKIVPQFTESDGDHHRGKYVDGQGIPISYDYRNFEGSSTNTVGYLFINYASLSVAKTNNVTSSLTGCTIEHNFFGGGSLGKVEGSIESTLNNCTVGDSVFGAGFSADIPTASVFPDGNDGLFQTIPVYNSTTGVFEKGVFPTAVKYKWTSDHSTSTSSTLVDADGGHWIYAPAEKLSGLGLVTGSATLSLVGTTTVTGCVFGGGDMSGVTGNTTVSLQGGAHVLGNVFGGGNNGTVGGNSSVTIQNTPEP